MPQRGGDEVGREENSLIIQGILADECAAMTWTKACEDGRIIELVFDAGGQVYWREAREVEQP